MKTLGSFPFVSLALASLAACGSSSSTSSSGGWDAGADASRDGSAIPEAGNDASPTGDAGKTDGGDAATGPKALACRPIQSDHIGVYRPSTATFYADNQRPGWIETAPPVASWGFGNPNWLPVVGDWDGNGSQTHGAFDGAGHFFLANTLGKTTADVTFAFGQAGDVPLAGDWSGSGTSTVGVFRASTGQFLLGATATHGATLMFPLGFVQAGDVPVAGDWDGDGVTTVGVFRSSNATFYLRNTNADGPADITFVYGATGDIPVAGDWDGDGKWTLGVQRGATYLLTNTFIPGNAQLTVTFGNPGDVLVTGNWNGSPRGYGAAPAELANLFPLAADYQPSSTFSTWVARKANALIRYPGPGCPYAETIDAWNAGAASAGLSMIRAPNSPASLDATLQGLIGWDMQDEPDVGGSGAASQVASTYSSLKGVSSSRPAFVNFAGPVVLSTSDACNGPGDGSGEDCYPAYIATEDWVSEDLYPVTSGDDLSRIGTVLDKLRRWSQGKPLFAYAQTSNDFTTSPTLTPDQLRGEMWEAIVHGVRGVFFFAAYDCDPGTCQVADGTQAPVAAEMTTQDARIAALASVLQTTVDPDGMGIIAPSPLEATWRQVGTSDTFIVLNDSATTVTRTLSICGIVATQPLEVVGEGRTVGSAGAPVFSDTFGPYEAHVYRADNAHP